MRVWAPVWASVWAWTVCGVGLTASAADRPAVDLSGYALVFEEDFSAGLNAYDGHTGLWSTRPRRDVLVTNGPQSVFLDGAETAPDGTPLGLNPFVVEDGALHIRSGPIPPDKKDAVAALLRGARQAQHAGGSNYYTGMISTRQTWGQTYGYFEIVAKAPAGKGRWPAFWLSHAGLGWPPEIDIFEAYGKGLAQPTDKDDAFNLGVYFDAVNAAGEAVNRVDIVNAFAPSADGAPQRPKVKKRGGGEQYVFSRRINARSYGADIYNEFWTYAVEWKPDVIIFYFGKSRDTLVEIYRTPTPDDLRAPMAVIANDQISSKWGWNPVAGLDDLTFAPGNDLTIRSISVFAMIPERTISGDAAGALLTDDDRSSRIIAGPGADTIVPGGGADMIELGGGSNRVFVARGQGNKIISGMDADDRVVLESFFFENAADAAARLTQVGEDVWLSNGADPADPQTLIFRSVRVEDLSDQNFVIRWPVTRNAWSSVRYNPRRLRDADRDGAVAAGDRAARLTDAQGAKGGVTLTGSREGDEYYIHRSDTVILEQPGGGVDTVYAARSYALPPAVENIVSKNGGKRRLTLTGNALGNRLESGPGDETLAGRGGDDFIDLTSGGADRVVYAAGDGRDTIAGFASDDRIVLADGFGFSSFADIAARIRDLGTDAMLDLGRGQAIIFRELKASALKAENFEYAKGVSVLAGCGRDPWRRPTGPVPHLMKTGAPGSDCG